MVSDPYKVLGISRDASEDEIKRAYRKKAKECHPDLHPDDPHAQEKMNEVNEAYDMLKNPDKYRTQQSYSSQGYSYNNQQTYNFYDFFGGYQQANTGRIPMPNIEPGDGPEIQNIVQLIRSRDYRTAYGALMNMSSYDRNARWHYLSSLAFCGLSDLNNAFESIQRAVQMEPGNQEYVNVYNVLRQKATAYQNPFGYQRTFYRRRHSIFYYFIVAQFIMWLLSALFGGLTRSSYNDSYTRSDYYSSPSQQYESEGNGWIFD